MMVDRSKDFEPMKAGKLAELPIYQVYACGPSVFHAIDLVFITKFYMDRLSSHIFINKESIFEEIKTLSFKSPSI